MLTTSAHPWIKHYPAGVSAEIDSDQHASLPAMYDAIMSQYANHTAFSNFGTSLSYADLNRYAHNVSNYLRGTLQLKKGDRIAIMMPNILQYPVVLFGILNAGMVVVNINPLYTASELKHQLSDADVSAIVVLENYAHVVEQAMQQVSINHVVITKIGDMLGCLKGGLMNFAIKHLKKMVPHYAIANSVAFKSMLSPADYTNLEPVTIESTDLAFLQYTGGTTGRPKGAMLTHGNMMANIKQTTQWMSPVIEYTQECVLAALPLYHIFSLTICCFCFLNAGSHCVLVTNPRDTNSFINLLKKTKITIFVGINTLFNNLLHQKKFHAIDFSALKLTVSGGMAAQKAVSDAWQGVTGCFILQGYGLTETSPVVCINPVDVKSFTGAIGLPVPSTVVAIRDDQNNDVAMGEPGELCVKGPQVMQGYWRQPNETAQVLDDEGWLKTGDIAVMDENGFITLIDRKKDIILVSGFNVYPNEIEDVMVNIAGVAEVCVVGIPDAKAGERVKAFVVRDNDTITAQAIISQCRQHLTNYKIPKEIEFRDDLPKSNVGKILRKELREQ